MHGFVWKVSTGFLGAAGNALPAFVNIFHVGFVVFVSLVVFGSLSAFLMSQTNSMYEEWFSCRGIVLDSFAFVRHRGAGLRVCSWMPSRVWNSTNLIPPCFNLDVCMRPVRPLLLYGWMSAPCQSRVLQRGLACYEELLALKRTAKSMGAKLLEHMVHRPNQQPGEREAWVVLGLPCTLHTDSPLPLQSDEPSWHDVCRRGTTLCGPERAAALHPANARIRGTRCPNASSSACSVSSVASVCEQLPQLEQRGRHQPSETDHCQTACATYDATATPGAVYWSSHS